MTIEDLEPNKTYLYTGAGGFAPTEVIYKHQTINGYLFDGSQETETSCCKITGILTKSQVENYIKEL